MPKGIKGYQKGHPQYNTGRTWFKKGHKSWLKGKHISSNRLFYENNPMKNLEIARKAMLNRDFKKIGKKISNALTGRKLSKERREKMSISRKGRKLSEEHKKKISLTRRNLFKKGKLEISFKNKTYEEFFGEKKAKEIKEKQSLNMSGLKRSEETIKKIKEARAKQITPKYDTKIEVKIQNFLKQLGITFFTHQYMKGIEHGYQCDILIPSINLVIECDGDYWHKYPVGTEIDHIRTSELLSKGFNVLRLWGSEIRPMELIDFENKLKEYEK